MQKSLEITCPCGEYDYFLEFTSRKKVLETFCPFCGTEVEEPTENNDDSEDE